MRLLRKVKPSDIEGVFTSVSLLLQIIPSDLFDIEIEENRENLFLSSPTSIIATT